MATGASNADARDHPDRCPQGRARRRRRRHAVICSLLGIRHVVLAVNKMDLVDYAQATFDRIVDDFRELRRAAVVRRRDADPDLGAIRRQRRRARPQHAPGTTGRRCSSISRSIEVDAALEALPFRFPVQWVNRPDLDFRGFAGTVASGRIRRGDPVRLAASGRGDAGSRGSSPPTATSTAAGAGDAVTLTLADELDIARGDLLVAPDRAAGGRRSVRGARHLDERRAAAARAAPI